MRFVVDTVVLGQALVPVVRFPLSISFYHGAILIFIYAQMLLLPDGQMSNSLSEVGKYSTVETGTL
jgi:hypothetical protein